MSYNNKVYIQLLTIVNFMGEAQEKMQIDRSMYDEHNKEKLVLKALPGINEQIVRQISKTKNEPGWMLQKRLQGLREYKKKKIPEWGPCLEKLDIEKIHLFILPEAKKNARKWEDVPKDIKKTFEKLGIPKAEREALAGVGAQYESEMIYHNIKKEWAEQGIVFLDCDEALKKYPELMKQYFMTSCVPVGLHKFSALHAAAWSGGTFIYVPKNVKVTIPLQAYFRMNAKSGGQFEHTLIIADEGSEVHYIEGCSAPQYTESSIHAGCVEIHVLKGARVRYSSIENWSKNTYNLNTKRGIIHENGILEWVNGNLGSGVTMLYPASILVGDNSKTDFIGIAVAGKGQNQDTGCKVVHVGKNTSSTIQSKSISQQGGITSYRGLVSVNKSADNATSAIDCDALMIDDNSKTNTYPYMDVKNNTAQIAHEAKVGKINNEQIFYLMSKGIDEKSAKQMIVSGFIEPIVKELPLEYAVELNRLIELEMEGSLG